MKRSNQWFVGKSSGPVAAPAAHDYLHAAKITQSPPFRAWNWIVPTRIDLRNCGWDFIALMPPRLVMIVFIRDNKDMIPRYATSNPHFPFVPHLLAHINDHAVTRPPRAVHLQEEESHCGMDGDIHRRALKARLNITIRERIRGSFVMVCLI